jgi:hypothetical protein
MTPEEAVETMTKWDLDNRFCFTENHAKAIKLGIEALKEIQRARLNGYRFVAVRLSGETEE